MRSSYQVSMSDGDFMPFPDSAESRHQSPHINILLERENNGAEMLFPQHSHAIQKSYTLTLTSASEIA